MPKRFVGSMQRPSLKVSRAVSFSCALVHWSVSPLPSPRPFGAPVGVSDPERVGGLIVWFKCHVDGWGKGSCSGLPNAPGVINWDHQRLTGLGSLIGLAGLNIIQQTMGPLLLAHRGYQVPQRDGHFMIVFHTPVDAARFHASLQMALLDVEWPNELLDLPDHLRPDSSLGRQRPSITRGSASQKQRSQLYCGLCVSFGLAVGYVTKELEAGRANYLGREWCWRPLGDMTVHVR